MSGLHIFALARRLSLIILGALLAIAGLVYGVTSHQITYRNVRQEVVAHFLSGASSSSDRTGYIQMENDPNLYVINESNFAPALNGSSFGDGDTVSFIYTPDETSPVDVIATNTSTHLQGTGYMIEKIAVFDSNGKNPPRVYTNFEYSRNPKGFYQNNWPIAGVVIAIGLLLAVLGIIVPFLLRRSRPRRGLNDSVGTPKEANPYEQQYQNPAHP